MTSRYRNELDWC